MRRNLRRWWRRALRAIQLHYALMQAMSTGDRAFFLFLALVILGEMMAGLLLDAVAVAVA